MVSVGGGAGILLADQVTEEGMRLADFAPETKQRMKALIEKNNKPERLVELKEELSKPLIISPRGFSSYVGRCRAYMAGRKLHTYKVPMMKPLSIAIRVVWQKYNRSFLE